ncbi:vegetative cell wall protein gp1-like [Oncorhynchus mykiss]|uniref:vegetative cell wall protein gp1-like n=1 Tax=Oncorhynchus mykiss TaxID=8022 RepID=UPI0018782190|nr:vegetative cell wall protein gp1-like [Oncorhynchus mykiss]XP_036803678.1 vegetative cell wall protein gp1-like [Oncorhynchus mykiss]XP_036803679.1 vegetative cell wall protein gp1-like [Oncorhynchus mykiss]
MTSVNSPACLLARNQFYRNTTSPTESIKSTAVYSLSDWSMLQVLVWVTMSTQPGFPGAGGISKGWWVSVVLGSPKPRTVPSSAPPPSPPPCALQPTTPPAHPSPAPSPGAPCPARRSSAPSQQSGPAPLANRAVQRPQPTERSSAPSQQSGPAPPANRAVQRP